MAAEAVQETAAVRRVGVAGVVGGILLLIEVAAVVVVTAGRPAVVLPVTASLADQWRQVAEVQLSWAVVVLLVFAAASLLLIRPTGLGPHDVRWAAFSVSASVTVFLVAQLNGVTDLTTLVPIYAMTTGMTLFAILQERTEVRAGHPMLPLCFGAAVGIVPWGLIAFTQIGSGVSGDAPSVVVRVITLVMLAFAATFFVTQWKEQRRLAVGGDPLSGERAHIVLTVAATSVFAWAVVLGVIVPAA